jgi:small-conductance mechanosensitive channel
MARKTSVKPSKKPASSAASMIKEFMSMPAKLVAQLRKELTGAKKQESKLTAALKKAQSQTKKAKNKSTAKKSIDKLTKALAAVKTEVKTLSQDQIKFNAVGKQLISFEKQWSTKKPIKKTRAVNKVRKTAADKPSLVTLEVIPEKKQTDTTVTPEPIESAA